MGQVQLWQSDGLGADKETLERVLYIFRSDGVQGLKSQQALNAYIQKLDDSKLREMYEIDSETALQLFADCFGVSFAARKYSRWESETIREANRVALERTRKVSNEEIDRIRREYGVIQVEKEKAEQRIKELQDTLAHYKADLYDFYAQAGKLPNYERG